MWACPHCRQSLRAVSAGKSLACPDGHAFDRAREGYVNLLASGLDAVDMAFSLSLFQLGG